MTAGKIVDIQRMFFRTHATLSYNFRIDALRKLRKGINKYQNELIDALKKDLNKSSEESYITEIGIVLKELTYYEKNLKKFIRPKRVRTSISDFPGKSMIYSDPYGVTLIVSPWNYPVNLSLCPLVGAIAAGNTIVIKPSEYSVNTSKVLEDMIKDTFNEEYIKVMTGGIEVNQSLLDQKFDYIFFTGSTPVGKIVMEKASKHLTPISLELGGKSPTIVDKTANIKISAKRIAFGKFINAGQTCIAPDYLLIHEDLKADFIEEFNKNIIEFFGQSPMESDNYGSIINQKHYNRLKSYLVSGKSIIGGNFDDDKLRISPTLIDEVDIDSKLMNEEIFGPILPLVTFKEIDEAISFVETKPKPLALYLFSEDKKTQDRVLRECHFGGGCINDTIVHIASDYLPFGGVGESGMGSYHGSNSFDTFSHSKSILKKGTWYDMPIRYGPYSKLKFKIIKFFLK